jgi:hypothetical protein
MHQMTWDSQCPSNTSYADHRAGLPLYLAQLLTRCGLSGVIVTSPEIAAILEIDPAYVSLNYDWWKIIEDTALEIGRLRRLSIWLNLFTPYNEARVYDHPGGKVLGTLFIVNLDGQNRNPLEWMAAT